MFRVIGWDLCSRGHKQDLTLGPEHPLKAGLSDPYYGVSDECCRSLLEFNLDYEYRSGTRNTSIGVFRKVLILLCNKKFVCRPSIYRNIFRSLDSPKLGDCPVPKTFAAS